VAAVTADASLDGLLLNGRLFQSPLPPTDYAAALASPVRIVEPSPPAPYGHRNNQIHLFDELGLYLIENHATRLVNAVVFVLWLEEAAFKPICEYSGELAIGGVRFLPGMTPQDYMHGTIAFEGPVLGLWHAHRNGIWIGLKAKRMRQPKGRRGESQRFVDVSFCFSSWKDGAANKSLQTGCGPCCLSE
jgi:hypothetical protein